MSVLADSSYPLLNVFWTMFEFFLWIIWIWILIWIFIDIFRSHDLSGWGKATCSCCSSRLSACWSTRSPAAVRCRSGRSRMPGSRIRTRQYVQQAAASTPANTADKLAKLADLRDRGVISAEEFDREKAKVLGSSAT